MMSDHQGTPEERKAVKAARKALRNNPTRIVINADGEAMPPPENEKPITIDGMVLTLDVVFIREDGWTLGCDSRHRDVAEDMWKGQWIGKLERNSVGGMPVTYQLTVYSQQGFEYESCVFNSDGTISSGKEPVEMDWNRIKPNPKGTTPEDVRKAAAAYKGGK